MQVSARWDGASCHGSPCWLTPVLWSCLSCCNLHTCPLRSHAILSEKRLTSNEENFLMASLKGEWKVKLQLAKTSYYISPFPSPFPPTFRVCFFSHFPALILGIGLRNLHWLRWNFKTALHNFIFAKHKALLDGVWVHSKQTPVFQWCEPYFVLVVNLSNRAESSRFPKMGGPQTASRKATSQHLTKNGCYLLSVWTSRAFSAAWSCSSSELFRFSSSA